MKQPGSSRQAKGGSPMKYEELMELYNQNKDFNRYVDHYCANYIEGASVPLEDALCHAIVYEVAKEYKRNGRSGDGTQSTHTPMGECL